VVADQYQGQFPTQFNDVHALPGIGRSTAGAILTFSGLGAYPILDGNVKRVFSRLLDIDQPVTKPSVEAQLWDFSQQLVDAAADPYSLNQGLMELGATLCIQSKPQCLLCPVQSHCQAFRNGTPHRRPVKVAKAPIPHKTIAVGVIWNDQGQVLVQRRPPEGLLGGLWEFPGGKQEPGEALEDTVRREIHEELDIHVQVNDLITTVNHAYTHFKITLHAYHCQYLSGTPTPMAADAWQWIDLPQLPKLSFPTANKKVLAYLIRP
jgi:A/G-specific adenine glycosylase